MNFPNREYNTTSMHGYPSLVLSHMHKTEAPFPFRFPFSWRVTELPVGTTPPHSPKSSRKKESDRHFKTTLMAASNHRGKLLLISCGLQPPTSQPQSSRRRHRRSNAAVHPSHRRPAPCHAVPMRAEGRGGVRLISTMRARGITTRWRHSLVWLAFVSRNQLVGRRLGARMEGRKNGKVMHPFSSRGSRRRLLSSAFCCC